MSDYADALARRNIQPPAQDTASVLAGLVEEMKRRADRLIRSNSMHIDRVRGIEEAIALVEAAQAATGAKAAVRHEWGITAFDVSKGVVEVEHCADAENAAMMQCEYLRRPMLYRQPSVVRRAISTGPWVPVEDEAGTE